MEKQGGVCKCVCVCVCVCATATRESAAVLRIPTGRPHHSDQPFVSSVITEHRTISVRHDYGLDSKLPGMAEVSMARREVTCTE